MSKHETWYRRATYTDGSLVMAGDKVRYHQALGGLMSPSTDLDGNMWNYGTAVPIPQYQDDPERRARAADYGIDVDELVLQCESGPYKGSLCHLFSHVIERVES